MGTSSGIPSSLRRRISGFTAWRLAPLLIIAATVGPTSATAQVWPERWGQGICYSQYGWCPLPAPERTPLGVLCYCVLPDNRYIPGTTSNLSYRGRVNPYFNPHTAPAPSVPTVIR